MVNFRGGVGGFRGKRDFRSGDRNDRPREMFDAICSSCDKDCQVPFRTSGGKPVFCRDCFSKEGGGRELGRQAGERGARRDLPSQGGGFNDRAPMRTSTLAGGDNVASSNEVKRQLEQVNVKLERLISAVQTLTQTGRFAKKVVPEKSLGESIKDVTKSAVKKAIKKTGKK